MLLDLTLRITPKTVKTAESYEKKLLTGHMGTHFDVMDKEFPLEYTKRNGICFDVRGIEEITAEHVDLNQVEKDMFVAFYTGFIEEEDYGTNRYFKEHPQLSFDLIDQLVAKEISIIALDCSGVRRGSEHTPTDQKCAEKGVFVIENMVNLGQLCDKAFIAHTYPMNYAEMTGLPCRVVAEL